MSEEVKETAEAIESAAGVVERGVEAVAAQIAELAAIYGETAWSTALFIVQIDAMSRLLVSGAFLSVAFGVLFYLLRPSGLAWVAYERVSATWAAYMAPCASVHGPESRAHNVAMTRLVFVWGGGVIAAIVAALNLPTLLNVWNWVAIFYPELYLAKRALDAVVSL